MEPKETKFCVYCGKKIFADAERCTHCGEWLNESSISRNHISYTYTSRKNIDEEDNSIIPLNNQNNANKANIGDGTEFSKVLPIRRLFLLMILTCGLYSIYWIYKTNCYIRDDLGKDVSPGWRTFLFTLIPIANIIVFYMTLNDMGKFIKQEGIECYSPGLNTVVDVLFGGIISFWVLINVQEVINEFWRIKEPNLPIRREFSNSEIIVMIIPLLILIFVAIFALLVILVSIG